MKEMSTVYINREHAVFAMDEHNKPAARCLPGDTVIFQTRDCFGDNIRSTDELVHTVPAREHNLATGPLYVEGAEPGDALKVDIVKIRIADQGCQGLVPGCGPLGEHIESECTRIYRVEDGNVIFSDELFIPIAPMIGVIGTAPVGAPVANVTPGEHGSNMDNTKIQEGVSLYLPVNVPGALLAIGDLHAVMGDGEASTCGLEISGEVTVKVDVIKEFKFPTPLVESQSEYITVASAESLDQAVKLALEKMHIFIKLRTDMDDCDIIALMSMACNAEICQVVNPLKTARATISRRLVE